MKPKLREEQKQTSRLYLRRKDHRDCIMDDIYHNAIWMNKEQDGEQKDELVWLKYPKDALMVATGRNNGWLGWIDTERQFNFGTKFGDANRKVYLFQFNALDCVLAYARYNSSDTTYYVTQDGIVWKQVQGTPIGGNLNYFGNDGFCNMPSYQASNNQYSINTTKLIYDEESDEWSFENKTLTISDAKGSTILYLCSTNEGCLVMEFTRTEPTSGADYMTDAQFVRIDAEGNRHEGMHQFFRWNEPFPTAYSNGNASTRCGNMCAFAQFERVPRNRTSGYWYWRLIVGVTTDYGENWTFTQLKSYGDNTAGYGRWHLFARGNAIYLMFATNLDNNGKVYFYKTTDGSNWEEIPLPSWIDLPIVKDGGYGCHTNPTTKETLRIAVAPNETTDADVTLFNMIPVFQGGVYENESFDRASYSIKFKDGEIDKDIEDFYLCIGNSGWRAYFDNEYLASSSKAYAYYENYNVVDIAETVQENDYVIRP